MLRVDRLRKTFGDTVAVDGVSFAVRPGEMFGFVGANGAGKTTTMRIIMGVLAADGGEITWRGERPTRAIQRAFGYMPEERGLYQKMKVAEQIEYFGRQYGLPAGAARAATAEWIDRLGLAAHRDDPVQALSLGNQQRAQLAVALVHDPDVLVLDEPFSGLDPLGVDALAEVLAEKRDAGVPIVFSSHQLDLVERLSDSVGIIKAGRMVAAGPVEDVRDREGRRLIRIEVRDADPEWVDRLPGRVVRAGDDHVLVDPAVGDGQEVLRAALKEGRVEHFGWERPTLSEIFREVVA